MGTPLAAQRSTTLSRVQHSVRESRALQMKLWEKAVSYAQSRIAQLGPEEEISYGDFVRDIAREGGIDVPAGRRVFDFLEGQGLVTYEFGQGVRRRKD